MAHHFGTDLDQLLLEGGQRPILDRLRRRQRAQEIAEVVGERMKLEPYRVGGERSARQSRPLDRAFALLDPLLARPALVVRPARLDEWWATPPRLKSPTGQRFLCETALGNTKSTFDIDP